MDTGHARKGLERKAHSAVIQARGLGAERYCLKKQVMLIIFITFANRERELRAIFRIDVHLV